MYRTREFLCPNCLVRTDRLLDDVEDKRPQSCQCGASMTKLFSVPAAIRMDTRFMAGSDLDDGFGNDQRSRKIAYAKARAAGVNPAGKKYCPSLCRKGKPFDPQAWVADTTDVKRICQKNGWGCDGAVKVPMQHIDEPEQPYRVADDLVQKHADAEIGGHSIGIKEYRNVCEKVRKRLTPEKGP